jgi:hypothetical protein
MKNENLCIIYEHNMTYGTYLRTAFKELILSVCNMLTIKKEKEWRILKIKQVSAFSKLGDVRNYGSCLFRNANFATKHFDEGKFQSKMILLYAQRDVQM